MNEVGELVIPLVVCRSQGGAYDDIPFIAGIQLGQIDAILSLARPLTYMTKIFRSVSPQVDLIAMHHGYLFAAAEDGEDDDWVVARFVLAELDME